jgi:hypothetical protein
MVRYGRKTNISNTIVVIVNTGRADNTYTERRQNTQSKTGK